MCVREMYVGLHFLFLWQQSIFLEIGFLGANGTRRTNVNIAKSLRSNVLGCGGPPKSDEYVYNIEMAYKATYTLERLSEGGGHNEGGRPHATEFVCNSLFFVVRYLFLRQTSVFSIYIRTKKSISSRFFHAEEDTTKTQQKNKRTNNDNNNEKTRFMDGRNPYLLR